MRRRRVLAGGVAVAAVAAGGAIVAAGGEQPVRAAEPTVARATATVERRDLVDREDTSGTLGYADPGILAAGVAGTLTGLREPGSTVTRGHSLYAVDGAAAAFLLYGELPAWRDFSSSMTDGEDVRQLERNLRALGYDPGYVNRDWSWKTTEAVEDFQRDRSLDDDGTLSRGEVVFRPGSIRVGEAKAVLGDQVSPGRPVSEFSSTEQVVTVDLDASRQRLARRGDSVEVTLPSGKTVDGRIEEVGSVATKSEEETTIAVTISVRGGGNLDQAPVDVSFAVERSEGVLAVPVKALLARQGGGYALELADGGMVSVEPGMYADDMVEVSGSGLREGQKVVTAE
jgi:peptidoglycan hydrolase-like protein with peptidoglycan-binding domain